MTRPTDERADRAERAERAERADNACGTESVDSLGKTFRLAREAQAMEQDDIARRLNIHVSILQAIESDRLQGLGAPVFVRMYLQRYAQTLGLPVDEVLRRYKALGIDAPPPLRLAHRVPQHRSTALRWLSYPLALALMGWLGWAGLDFLSTHLDLPGAESLSLLGSRPEPNPDSAAPPAATPSTARFDVADPEPLEVAETALDAGGQADEFIALSLNEPKAQPSLPIEPGETRANLALVETSRAAETASFTALDDSGNGGGGHGSEHASGALALADAPDGAAVALSPADDRLVETESAAADSAPDNEHQLSMSFAQDCWVEVKDANGERLAWGIIRAKDERTWSGAAPFSIKLGHAQAVDIKLDGKAVDKSVYTPKRGTVSRFVLQAPQAG